MGSQWAGISSLDASAQMYYPRQFRKHERRGSDHDEFLAYAVDFTVNV